MSWTQTVALAFVALWVIGAGIVIAVFLGLSDHDEHHEP